MAHNVFKFRVLDHFGKGNGKKPYLISDPHNNFLTAHMCLVAKGVYFLNIYISKKNESL